MEKVKNVILKSMIADGLDPEFVYSIEYRSFSELEPKLRKQYEIRKARENIRKIKIIAIRMPPIRYEFIGQHRQVFLMGGYE
jgi:hypothetical protein